MDFKKRKYQLVEKLLEVNDEATIYKLESILKKEYDIPAGHKETLDQRLNSYLNDPDQVMEWNDLKEIW